MNAGSSSVKWKLFELETEKVVAKGLVERMLMPGSKFEIKYGEQNFQETYDNLTYERACELIIEKIQYEVGHRLSRKKAEAIWNRAYEDGHSFGFYEIRCRLSELIDLAITLLGGDK